MALESNSGLECTIPVSNGPPRREEQEGAAPAADRRRVDSGLSRKIGQQIRRGTLAKRISHRFGLVVGSYFIYKESRSGMELYTQAGTHRRASVGERFGSLVPLQVVVRVDTIS